jgi:hypothetical protein
LGQIVAPNVKAFLLGVDKLERFIEGPSILPHEICGQYSTGPTLPMQGVNEAALALLHSLLHKGEDSIQRIVLLIKDLHVSGVTFSSFSVQWTERYCTPNRS